MGLWLLPSPTPSPQVFWNPASAAVSEGPTQARLATPCGPLSGPPQPASPRSIMCRAQGGPAFWPSHPCSPILGSWAVAGEMGALGGVSRLALTAPAVPVLGTLGSAPGPGGQLPLCQLPWDREAGYTKCSLHNWHEDTRKAPGKSKQP